MFVKNGDNKWHLEPTSAIQTFVILITFLATILAVHFRTINRMDVQFEKLNGQVTELRGTGDRNAKDIEKCESTIKENHQEFENFKTYIYTEFGK